MARYTRYAPEYQIRIDGDPLPAAIRASIASVTYTDGMEGADRVEVSLANPSLRLLDHPLLSVNHGFKLSIGYAPDPLEEVFVGEITGVEPSFAAGGMPSLRITAQDFLNRLTRGTKSRAFRINIPSIGNFPIPDNVVAGIVAASNALIPSLQPIGGPLGVLIGLASFLAFPQFAQNGVRKQSNQSDFDLLSAIARENGWAFYIDHTAQPRGRVLRFQFLIQDFVPSLTLEWGASLMDFTPRLTTVGDVYGVSARVWVDSLKTEFVIVVSWNFDTASLNVMVFPALEELDSVIGEDAASRTVAAEPSGFASVAQKILTELLPRLNNRLTGGGSVVGDPRIKASRVVLLKGLGDQFSGLYRITSATHQLDGSGYRTTFQARQEVWFSGPPPPSFAGAGRVIESLVGKFSV